MENMSSFRQTKLAITLRSFAKGFIFLKLFLKCGSIATSNSIPHIPKQAFLKVILLNIMKTIVKLKFDLKLADKDPSLAMMYWLNKFHKTPIGARFIIASKNCSSKPLSGMISKIFNAF